MIVRVSSKSRAAPRVLVPVPEEVKELKLIVPELMVASPLPENTTVEVLAVNAPPAVIVIRVPVVPDKVIVEALAVSVPAEPIVNVVPLKARLVLSEVFKVPLTVIVPSTAESTFIVTVWPAVTVTVSAVVGTWPQSQVPAVFQLPVAKEAQAVGLVNVQPLPAVATL